jgi:hypothetical protein
MNTFIQRWSFRLFVIISVYAFCMPGCAKDQIDHEFWTERARAELKPFKQRLMGALTESLRDGPETTIDVCRVLAPAIAGEISSAGVEVGRTSHKLRNDRNAPREWVKPLLNAYVTSPNKSGPEIVRLEHGGIGYVEPIFVKPMCLVCHGSAITPSVASRIEEHYPKDAARNFEAGDFRGLFWVEFKEGQLGR